MVNVFDAKEGMARLLVQPQKSPPRTAVFNANLPVAAKHAKKMALPVFYAKLGIGGMVLDAPFVIMARVKAQT